MNVKLVFRIFGGFNFLRAVVFLFLTERYLASAGVAVSSEAFILAQALGVITFCVGLLAWRTPDIAGDALSSLGQLFGIGNVLWFLIVGYHIMTGKAGGTTGYANVLIFVVLAVLFFMQSRKSE